MFIFVFFSMLDEGNPERSLLSELPFEVEEDLIKTVIEFIGRDDMFPGRTIFPSIKENIFVIETLPTESVNDLKDIYFSKLDQSFSYKYPKNDSDRDPQDYQEIFCSIDVHAKDQQEEIMYDSYLGQLDVANNFLDLGKQLNDSALNSAFFSFTNLSGANFFESGINNAMFIEATLYYANFNGTRLTGSNFKKADLRYAQFKNANLISFRTEDNAIILTSFVNANLRHADLSGANFSYSDLSGADLRMAIVDNNTNFTGCKLTGTKFAGTNWEIVIFNETAADANITDEYVEDDEVNTEYDDDNHTADYANSLLERAEISFENDLYQLKLAKRILDPLVINPANTFGSTCTFENIVEILTPKIRNAKRPISEMKQNKWYGISSLGNTDLNTWHHVGVKNEPHIGTVFECIYVPPIENNEAIVYESVAPCMAIHELSRPLEIDLIFQTFLDCVGSDVIKNDYHILLYGNDSTPQTKLELSAILLYNLIFLNLSMHNAYETADSWTHIYDNIDHNKILVKHAVFHRGEGLMNHPQFDHSDRGAHPEQLFYLVKFIELLPQQIQVAWAQFYIKEFIEGYGQELETFDPTVVSPEGFIASCINGNIEKMLLSIRTAITQFYPPGWGLEPVTEENEETEKKRVLKATITGSEFEKYFFTTDDDSIGPSLEGYRMYIKRFVNPEFREQYLNLLEDQEVIDTIQANIDITSGGRKSARLRKRNKTFKKKSKKTIKKKKLYKRKKTIKKKNLYKRKRTIKINKLRYNRKK